MIENALKKVVDGNSLSKDEMALVMDSIMDGNAKESQVAALLTALKLKGESVDEIAGAAMTMKKRAIPVSVSSDLDLIDIVGTGGDMSSTFNISTAAAFVLSGAGLNVAKHGNRAVSSRSGSADVLESLGINIDLPATSVVRCIEETGIGFLFARTLHPAMKNVAQVRNDLGFRTIFNILGPLTNPSGAKYIVAGVFDKKLLNVYCNVLKTMGCIRAFVVHGLDGLDEISLCSETLVSELKNGQIIKYAINPEEFGFKFVERKEIEGGDADKNAEIILNILKGEKSPNRDIVCINSAAGLIVSGSASNFNDAAQLAEASIDSGKALQKLNSLIEISQKLKTVK